MASRTVRGVKKKKERKNRSRVAAMMDLFPIWNVLMNDKIISRHHRIEFSLHSTETRNEKNKS